MNLIIWNSIKNEGALFRSSDALSKAYLHFSLTKYNYYNIIY